MTNVNYEVRIHKFGVKKARIMLYATEALALATYAYAVNDDKTQKIEVTLLTAKEAPKKLYSFERTFSGGRSEGYDCTRDLRQNQPGPVHRYSSVKRVANTYKDAPQMQTKL